MTNSPATGIKTDNPQENYVMYAYIPETFNHSEIQNDDAGECGN